MRQSDLKLFPYQEDGVRFLTGGFHKLLADDMGLGKTIQVIAALDELKATTMVVICPAGVKIHWARKIAQWSEFHRNVFIVRDGKTDIPGDANIIILNYELLLNEKIYKQLLVRGKNRGYDLVVCDEAHYLKSLSAKRTKRVLGKKSFLHFAKYKWMLTGTPVLNRPAEIYPMLKTLAPQAIEPYDNWMAFSIQFCNARKTKQGIDSSGHSNVLELAKRMEGFMLRRKKEDVLDQLPDKIETLIELEIDCEFSESDTPLPTLRRELGIAKTPQAMDFIREILSDTPKVVVFAHHTSVIQSLREGLSEFNPVVIQGGMSTDDKQTSLDNFITDAHTRVFIGQTLAGGLGIDGLQTVCNYVVFIELDWSPGIMDQAIDRCRRIGQKETVYVYYLAVANSLDTKMENILDKKRTVINQILSTKEVIPMATPNPVTTEVEIALAALSGIAAAVEGIKLLIQKTHGTPTTGVASAKPVVKAKEVVPDPLVNAPAPKAATVVAETVLTMDDVRKLTSAFLATPNTDRETNKAKLKQIIFPEFGATELAKLTPSNFGGYAAALAKGPDAFTLPDGDDLGDV